MNSRGSFRLWTFHAVVPSVSGPLWPGVYLMEISSRRSQTLKYFAVQLSVQECCVFRLVVRVRVWLRTVLKFLRTLCRNCQSCAAVRVLSLSVYQLHLLTLSFARLECEKHSSRQKKKMPLNTTKCVLLICICSVVFHRCEGILRIATACIVDIL